jgi:Spy/CpxP family protein refolding chaperone
MSAKSLSGFATQHQSRIRAAACSVLLAVALGPTGAAAQALSDLTPDMRTRLEAAEQRLNLTPEQRSQVHAIVIEEVDKLKGIDARHEDDTSRATRRELVARDAYFWAWPMINMYNKRLNFETVHDDRRSER